MRPQWCDNARLLVCHPPKGLCKRIAKWKTRDFMSLVTLVWSTWTVEVLREEEGEQQLLYRHTTGAISSQQESVSTRSDFLVKLLCTKSIGGCISVNNYYYLSHFSSWDVCRLLYGRLSTLFFLPSVSLYKCSVLVVSASSAIVQATSMYMYADCRCL